MTRLQKLSVVGRQQTGKMQTSMPVKLEEKVILVGTTDQYNVMVLMPCISYPGRQAR
jgi:hypothetical protein